MQSFWQLRQAMLKRINPRIKTRFGLDLADVFLLGYVAHTDMSPSALAETMQIPAHAISRRLDGLEKSSLIRRTLDPQDQRRRVVTLTQAGQKTLRAARGDLHQEIEAMLGSRSTAELEPFLNTMNALAESASQTVSA